MKTFLSGIFVSKRKKYSFVTYLRIFLLIVASVIALVFGAFHFGGTQFQANFDSGLENDETVKKVQVIKQKLKNLRAEEIDYNPQNLAVDVLELLYYVDELKLQIHSYDAVGVRNIPQTVLYSVENGFVSAESALYSVYELLQVLSYCQKNIVLSCVNIHQIDEIFLLSNEAKNAFLAINKNLLPEKFLSLYEGIEIWINKFNPFFEFYNNNRDYIVQLFDDSYPHNVLFLLQNSSEARPTGGFIGSMLHTELYKGEVFDVNFLDSHYIDYASGVYIDAPDYLPYLKRMAVHEANIHPFTDSSGQYIAEMYEQINNVEIDGVIFINVGILNELMDIVPVFKVDKYTLTKQNIFEVLQWEIEKQNIKEYEKVKTPKAFLFKVIEKLMSKIVECACYDQYEELFHDVRLKKLVQVYVSNQDVQLDVGETGFAFNDVQFDQENFILPSFSSYFSKANRFTAKSITHNIVQRDEVLDHTLIIDIQHHFDSEKERVIKLTLPLLKWLSDESYLYILNVLGKNHFKFLFELYLPNTASQIRITGITDDKYFLNTSDKYKVARIADIIHENAPGSYEITFQTPVSEEIFVWKQPDQSLYYDLSVYNASNQKNLFSGKLERDITIGIHQ